jgi:hypothetical protein
VYEISLPSCLQCVKLRARLTQAQTASVRAVLIRELAQATIVVAWTSMELNAITNNFPRGTPLPAGNRGRQNASNAVSMARTGMKTAQNRLDDYLAHGIVPEDLKQSR